MKLKRGLQNMYEERELEFAVDNEKTGFRLLRMELLNWGTFNNKIWKISTTGFNSLLTGDIGSGKSTVIDAITTLLVPHHKITFNKAAGSEKRERTLYSYIRGEYKNQKDEIRNISKSVYLRDEKSYSVLLGVFSNSGYNQTITLAQIFWLKDDKPQKLFFISQKDLNIKEYFTDFGQDITSLKKKLSADSYIEVFKNFSEYSSRFRSFFGIRSEKALDLFFQTVSLKQVGNLTDFIRNQMLEKTDAKEIIDELKKNFDNLNRAHDAVIKAKKQLEKLKPIDEKAKEYERSREKMDIYKYSKDALPAYIFSIKRDLLIKEIKTCSEEHDILKNQLATLDLDLESKRKEEIRLTSDISNNKEGIRIREIENTIEHLEANKSKKLAADGDYKKLAENLKIILPANEKDFYQILSKAKEDKTRLVGDLEKLLKKHDEYIIQKNNITEKVTGLNQELLSLKSRQTQIPKQNLDLRAKILDDLNLPEKELPFIGELIRVKKEEQSWQGAIERLLHNFGLSLLVPESHYKRVSNYVNKTNLKGRLVYFKVDENISYKNSFSDSNKSLFSKLEIKGDSIFYHWLENEINQRFNFVCCDTMNNFYHYPYAITKEGQIKTGKYRHEKDDRINIYDKRNYILGWDNKDKIRAVEIEQKNKTEEEDKNNKNIKRNQKLQEEIRGKDRNYDFFIKIDDYSLINWQKEVDEIELLTKEKQELEKSSNQLQVLRKRLLILKENIDKLSKNRDFTLQEKSKLSQLINNYQEELEICNNYKDVITREQKDKYFPEIEKFINKNQKLSIKNIDLVHNELLQSIEAKLSSYSDTIKKHYNKLLNLMSDYKRAYPEETQEVDLSDESIPDFRQFLQKIENDDLPRYENRFRELLKEKTIQDIALFRQQLDIQSNNILEKIEHINNSLREIEYNPGTYITLITDNATDIDIRNFQLELKNCLDSALNENELYSEEKFKQVKKLLDKFKEDLNWTYKVTDVRNWFLFGASERWQEDDSEKEYFDASSGKSGGQKEKLAYTILASALAYQFGLEWNTIKSRSFRFVVIDEAFGRGSDESTKYGLELFKKLNLQLLIVTPLQKINIIENYIKTIHFVNNNNGYNSQIQDIDIIEYKKNKEKNSELTSQLVSL